MSGITNDNQNQGIKVFREHTTGIDNDRKNTQQGQTITAQSDIGVYTVTDSGDECGWVFTPPATGQRHDMGAWSHAHPAILKSSDSKVYPVKDKTLAIDTDFAAKTQDSSAGSDATKIRVAEDTSDGSVGIVLQCLNDDAHEQIFFAGGSSKYVKDKGDGTGIEVRYNTSTSSWDEVSGSTLTMVAIEPTANFHNTTPPWKTDRIYIANKKGSIYLVDVQGFG